MLLLTWNLAGRKSKINSQISAVLKHNPDIIAFQEVTKGTKDLLRSELQKAGYDNIEDSFDLCKDHRPLVNKRKYGQMIASKYKLKCRDPKEFDVPWKERILSVDVFTNSGRIELHTTHIPPGSSNGIMKIRILEGIFERLNKKTKKLRILCGDFNTPQLEQEDGTVFTWAYSVNATVSGRKSRHHSSNGILRALIEGSEEKRWDDGERNVLLGLKKSNLHDVFRKIHGYEKQEYSWHVNHGKKTGRRFDHIFASEELNLVKCFYDHDVRTKGLSDHSAMVAKFDYD